MLKELAARVALVLFITGLTAKTGHQSEISDDAKQQPANSANTSGEP
jgi:hypothetical protein